VFENRVLRIFGHKRDEIVGGWTKLHTEELHNLYSSPNIMKMTMSMMRLACSMHGGEEECMWGFREKDRRST
jgi:hypothetical protein